MSLPRRISPSRAGIRGLLALLVAGCATVMSSAASVSSYPPKPVDLAIPACATLEVRYTLAPELRRNWRSKGVMDEHCRAAEAALRNDLTTSGLFARGVTDDPARADLRVALECTESHPSDYRLRAVLTATETATGRQVASCVRETSLGESSRAYFSVKMNTLLPGFMAALKDEFARNLRNRTRRETEATAALNALQNASLAELVVPTDPTVEMARTRNRALIAAKTTQLPDILRNWKTAELTALVVKVEQTVLDLNHECEVLKDKAQQTVVDESNDRVAAAAGRGRAQVAVEAEQARLDAQRGLAISYRERIELLKPVLAALKEEIANRGR